MCSRRAMTAASWAKRLRNSSRLVVIRAEVDDFQSDIAIHGHLMRAENGCHAAAPDPILNDKIVNAAYRPSVEALRSRLPFNLYHL